LPSPSPPPPPPVTWVKQFKSTYSGANISTYGDIDLVDCKKICEKNSLCVGLVRPVNITDNQIGQCILKKELGTRTETRYTDGYLLTR
jgi:hypothetical protein